MTLSVLLTSHLSYRGDRWMRLAADHSDPDYRCAWISSCEYRGQHLVEEILMEGAR